ncbi:hypothetical protein FY557_09265 [Chryseobacterium sp. SN22]|uniref:hypothetical protein n=1 Tax=Chryseobacterium sp. SN22 TaxID=2606431 RepID=UPI0011EDF23B|nr:hypothetical protein [Chryseobacterium sp. SN22]KAA0128441.1 hypothetical protein FY557_09265 [Chryseobacterium sp. SN22]
MNKIYALLSLFVASFFFAQNSQLYYYGQFLDPKGKAQNFLKVYNKNGGIYEMTDEKGFAVIAAKPSDTLVWNGGKDRLVIRSYGLEELKTILQRRIRKETVKNIYTKDYDNLVSYKQEADPYSVENAETALSKDSDRYLLTVRKIRQKNDTVYKIKQQYPQNLLIGGSFTSSFEVKSRNAISETQGRFVQGRSDNGMLVWRGPETNEMFSFGPNIVELGFNNQSYEYDVNGKLVPLSDGIFPAKAYRNDLFKTMVGFSNQLKINVVVKKGYYETLRLSVDLGQHKDPMYFNDQVTVTSNVKARANANIKGYALNAAFAYDENMATDANRTGLFNRMYRNALLTPISFSNEQSILLPNGSQRSYSRFADNPLFLSERLNKYNYRSNSSRFSFDLSRTFGKFKLNLSQSYENDRYLNSDLYKPSTSGFTNGIHNARTQHNTLLQSNILGNYSFGNYDFKNIFGFNFILNDQKSEVFNSLTNIESRYQRTSQDYLFNYSFELHGTDIEIGSNVGNSFYISNTSKKNIYWLPKANAYIRFDDIFDWSDFNVRASGAYTEMSSEPQLTNSYSFYATTLLKAENSGLYFPADEAVTFNGLSNTGVKEWKTGLRLDAGPKISIEGEYFNRGIFNDVFPVYENNRLQLKNLADHTYKGYEFNFSFNRLRIGSHFFSTQKVSFYKYRDVAGRVESGYNNLAVAGFSDVYKTLTQGQVLGAVMGSYWERTADGQLIIDASGYPQKAAGMKIIADPTPDFIMKFNHHFIFKRLTLDIDWEWKKGGQLWNGTEAVLDYYGRSRTSGDQRDIKNYIFAGINANGNTNETAVDFYDPGRDVLQNRWSRYGYSGVAEAYIQKADYVRISNISLSANLPVNQIKTSLVLTFYVGNILLWQANTGADPNQNFYDQENGRGLDFFNLPSFRTFGCMVSFKF